MPNRSAVNNDASSRIYVAYCASCHGEDGRGLPDLGFNLVGNAFIRTSSNAELREFLMIGRRPGSPDSKMDLLMPAFDYLTDEELNAAIAQLRHLNGG
ncbi:MAG: cytochrome c [Rhodobacteraceae bacterium]|nr:cytochrome c [Paracoccaceae bacterium]